MVLTSVTYLAARGVGRRHRATFQHPRSLYYVDHVDTEHTDPAAWTAERHVTALYQAQALSLARLALVLLGDAADAEDVVQDAFLGLYRRWDNLTDASAASAYLRVATGKLLHTWSTKVGGVFGDGAYFTEQSRALAWIDGGSSRIVRRVTGLRAQVDAFVSPFALFCPCNFCPKCIACPICPVA